MSKSPSGGQAKTAPPSHLTVEMPDGQRELFMSFGLLGELASLIGGPEAVPQISFDGNIRIAVLTFVLAKRNKRGTIQEPGENDDPIVPYEMPPETAEQILDWVAAHVLDFFIRRFATSSKLFATQADQLAAVGSSLISSPNSPGKTV